MTNAILEITDGTTRVDLINPSSGFHLIGWTPQITDYKGGGVFQNPPLADWRQLRAAKWDTAQERFELTLNGANPNGVAYLLQQLRRLLEKANQYWTTDWQNDPVWLVAKAACETETRYCLIVKGRLANDQNHYLQPFTGNKSTMENLPLLIERRAWLENAPGVGTNTEISALEAYDGINFGNVDSAEVRETATSDNAVFVANKRNTANLTNIHIGTAGANLIGAALPFNLFSGTTATYFGIDTSVSNSGPFVSLVFDLIGGIGATTTITWEYWNGAWTTLTVNDRTDNFKTTNILSVAWSQPSDWTTNTPGGALPTGYWVRATPSVAYSTIPQQQNRNVYSVTWPYIEIQSDDVGGDIPALMRMILFARADTAGGNPDGYSNRILAGIRSISRGEDFTAFINCANEQNPSGITVTAGTHTSFVTDSTSFPNSASGVAALFASINTSVAARVTIQIASSLLPDFYGKYRAFLRTTLSGDPDEMSVFLRMLIGGSNTVIDTETVLVGDSDVLDMGVIEIPGIVMVPNDAAPSFNIEIRAGTTDTGTDIYFHDLVLIPVDEFVFDTSDYNNQLITSRIGFNGYLDFDGGVRFPKRPTSFIKVNSGAVIVNWQIRANGTPILQANSRQRLWIFSIKNTAIFSDVVTSSITDLFNVAIKRNQRYLSLRGEQ